MFRKFYLHLKISTKNVPLVPTHGDVWDKRVGPMGHEQSMIVSGSQTLPWRVSWFLF